MLVYIVKIKLYLMLERGDNIHIGYRVPFQLPAYFLEVRFLISSVGTDGTHALYIKFPS